jgi:superfamily II DNA or RNA helicase
MGIETENFNKLAALCKSSAGLQKLQNYFSLAARPVFGKATADLARKGVSVIGPHFETSTVLDHLGDYIPKVKGTARSYDIFKGIDPGAVGEIKKSPVLVNLSGETKKDLANEIGVKRNTQVLGEGNVGVWDKLEEAQNSPGFIPKAQDLANLITHKNQLRGGKAEEILNKAYPSGWVVKKRDAGSTLQTIGKKHPELFFSGGKDSLHKISPKTILSDWMVQEKKQIDTPAFNQVTNNLAKKLFNYHGGSGQAEYRVHSIDGKVIPGATIDRGSPLGFVKNFVPGWETSRREMLEKYMQQALNKLPADRRKLNYGADIAMTPEGKPFVVEMNPISNEGSSGYYANPVVVDAIRAAIKGRKNLQDITRQYVIPTAGASSAAALLLNQSGQETTKQANEHLDGLLTSENIKDKLKYVLGKDELQKPRELSDEENNRLSFRKNFGWSLFDPVYDNKKRDVFQHIQNPMYRATLNTMGSGILGAITPAVMAGMASGASKYAPYITAAGGLLGTMPALVTMRDKYKKQKLYNEITEAWIRHHNEGAIENMPTVIQAMTKKPRNVTNLKPTAKKIKTGGLDDRDYMQNPGPAGFTMGATTPVPKKKFKIDYNLFVPAIMAPFRIWETISTYGRSKAELTDLKDRFVSKLKEKEEAEIFLQKVRKPLFRQHQGLDEKLQKFDNLFKESNEKPGLWANIRAKKARGEKLAKPGDKDYPDKEQWKKLSKASFTQTKKGADKEEFPMLPHQQRVIDRLKAPDQPGLILMHGLGSGKTRSSIEAYKALGLPAEVLLPAALRGNYEKELKKWVGKHPKDIDIKSQQGVARDGANPEDYAGKLMVIDEAHRLRNEDSKLYQTLKKVNPQKRLLLTGTPIYNHPADIAKLINLAAGKEILPERKPEFEKEYIGQKTIFPTIAHRILGVKPGQELSIKNKDFLKRVFNKLIDYHGGGDEGFPDMTHEKVEVPMERSQERIYQALMKQLPWHLRLKVKAGLPPDKKELDKLIPFLSGARMISNSSAGFTPEGQGHSPKIERAADFLKAKIKENPNYKALIYSNYLGSGVDPYKKLLTEANIPFGEFTGDINESTRNHLVHEYNKNKLKALIVSSAGGEGLDLKGTRLVQILEPHFNNEKLKQVIGRAARYKSHESLSPAERNVLVQNYISTISPNWMGRKRTSTDQYLQTLADNKDALNNEFIKLIKSQADERLAKTSAIKEAKSTEILKLIEAKKKSDNRDYIAKNHILQTITHKNPKNFKVDSYLNKKYVGLTHIPSGFKIHAPRSILPAEIFTN